MTPATPARIRRPRRPEGAPALAAYISVADVERATGLPLSTCYEVMDDVARLAGLDLSQRATRAKLLPLDVWNTHSPAVLAPTATSTPTPPARRPQTPPRATLRASAAPESAAPAVPLTTPRKRRPVAA